MPGPWRRSYRDALILSSTWVLQRAHYDKDSALREKLIAQADAYNRRAGVDPKFAPGGR